jgi:hypothetical protein
MPLKLRPTGVGHGVYKGNVDYGVFCGEWCIGRIYETRTGPESLRWFWALHLPNKPQGLRTDNCAATLGEAKAELRQAGDYGRRGRSWKRTQIRRGRLARWLR